MKKDDDFRTRFAKGSDRGEDDDRELEALDDSETDGFDDDDDDDDDNRDGVGQVAQPMGAFDIRHLTVDQLASLGVSHLAYVKPVIVNGTLAFAIHGADGTPMAVAGARDLAFAAIRQHEMVPSFVH